MSFIEVTKANGYGHLHVRTEEIAAIEKNELSDNLAGLPDYCMKLKGANLWISITKESYERLAAVVQLAREPKSTPLKFHPECFAMMYPRTFREGEEVRVHPPPSKPEQGNERLCEIGALFEEYARVAAQIGLDGIHAPERYTLLGSIEGGRVLPAEALDLYQKLMAEQAARRTRRDQILSRLREMIPDVHIELNGVAHLGFWPQNWPPKPNVITSANIKDGTVSTADLRPTGEKKPDDVSAS